MKKLQIWIGIFLIIFLMTGCSGSNAKTAKTATTEYSKQTADVSTEKTTEEEIFTKEDVAAMEAGEIISEQMLKTLDTDELFYEDFR
jgi:PBP1b-binding outer membrane lipoprotein LpoB